MKRGNGFGSVIKLGGKRRRPYAARVTQGWTLEGKQIIKYIGYYTTKREAVKALEAYNTNPYKLDVEKLTTLELYEKWADQQKLSESAFKTYASTFKKCTAIYKIPFDELKLIDLERCMELQSTTMKKAFKNLMVNLYRYAMKYEIVEKNLADHLEYESFQSREKNIFEIKHIKQLWKNLDHHLAADVPLILLYTGVRINELLTLKSENVNIKEKYFITGSKTDAGKNRIVPIHDKILPLIKKRLKAKTEYLITTERGKPLNPNKFRQNEWVKTVDNVVDGFYTPHECRHTFITHISKTDANRAIIQRIVGHASKEVTDIYIHNTIDELLETVNKLEYK